MSARRTFRVVLTCLALCTSLGARASLAQQSADTVAAPQSRRVEVSGFLQAWYKTRREATGDATRDPDFFRLHRVRIQFSGRASKHVRYEVEVDPRSPEVTGVLRDAFVSLDYVPRHEIRIGQQKTMFGWENPTSSSRLFTVNRTELSEGIARGINLRDIGIGLIGSVRLTKGLRFEDALTLVNGSGINVQADSTATKNLWGRVGLRYRAGETTTRVGVSGATGDQLFDDSTAAGIETWQADISRIGFDVQFDHPRLLFVSEWAQGDDKAPPSRPDAGGRTSGYYVLLVGKPKRDLGPVLRYDVFEDFKRWTLGAFVGRPSGRTSLLFNYELVTDEFGKHDDKIFFRLQVRF